MRISISASRRVAAAALCSAALAAAATGCGTKSGASGTPATAGTSSPAAGPLAGLTGGQIASKAVTDFKAASSFRIVGSDTESGQTTSVDLASGTTDCIGTLVFPGQGSILLVKKGNRVWLKADARYLESVAGRLPASVLHVLEGKYLEPTKGRNLSGLTVFCDRGVFTRAILGDLRKMRKGKDATISGQPALELRNGTATAYVTVSAHPMLLRVIDNGGRGRVDFTDYNAPVSVTAPPADQTLDGAKYGF